VQLRRLGGSGLTVSAIGLGCNNFGRPETATQDELGVRAVVDAALTEGVVLFDVADVYGAPRGRSEELLGEALLGRRDQAVIATKFGADMGGRNGADLGARASRRYIRQSVERSLQRLRTDWIDLYQLHRPDLDTPIEETLSTLDDLVREGKIRYVGHSNLSGWQIADFDWTARHHGLARPISAQNHYSLLERRAEREVVPACEHFELGLLPYFPLASGLLTGKYRRGETAPPGTRLAGRAQRLADAPWDRVEALTEFATDRGRSLLDVAIGGLAAQPTVASVIAGATTPEQVKANAGAGHWQPTADDLAALDTICPPGR
jgi:aryl-alcohol dehydrogenase-like predicted oxidoreductase